MLRWINSSLSKSPASEAKEDLQRPDRFIEENLPGQILDL
jgi:hypothetical protein